MKISVVLEALTGSFDTDIDKSASKAEKRWNKMAEEFDRRARIVAAAGAAAALATAAFTKKQIDAADRALELSQAYGIAVETLSQYSLAAATAGLEDEDLAKGMSKLAKNAYEAAGGNKALLDSFKLLGVEVKDQDGNLKSLDTLLLDVAEAFSQIEDGTAKAALAQEIFGKSGVGLIPFLNEGRAGLMKFREEADALGLTMSTSMAEGADHFNDNIERLEGALAGVARDIAVTLLPALETYTDQMVDAAKSTKEFHELGQTIALGAVIIAESFVGMAKAVRAVIGSFEVVIADLMLIGEFIGRGGVIGLAFEENREALAKELEERNRVVEEANRRWSELWSESLTTVSDSMRAAIAEAKVGAVTLQQELDNAIGLSNDPLIFRPGVSVEPEVTAPFLPGFGPEEPTKRKLEPPAGKSDEDRALEEHEKQLARIRDQVLLVNDAEGELAQMRAMVNELYAAGKIPQDAYLAFLEESSQKLDEAVEQTDNATDQMTVFWETAARNAQSAFADFLFDPFKGGLEGMLDGFMTTLRRMAAEALAAQIFQSMGFGNQGGSAATIASFFGGGRASGGDVVPGKWYMVGEEGPEPFIPRTPGTILPTGSAIGKMGNNISITMNMDNRGADPASAANLARAADEIARKTEERVYETLRRDIALVTP